MTVHAVVMAITIFCVLIETMLGQLKIGAIICLIISIAPSIQVEMDGRQSCLKAPL